MCVMYPSQLIPIEQAVDCLLERVEGVPKREILPLERVVGRVCGEEIQAPMNQPPFHRSPLDGYALRSQDSLTASQENPVVLQVLETVFAGQVPGRKVGKGETIQVMTGTMLPEGADCVVKQEDVLREGEWIKLPKTLTHHQNFCLKGEDLKQGELLLSPGETLGFADIGMLASQGITEVFVYQCPRIGILPIGDELCLPGIPLKPGKIYDSNGPLIHARLLELGMEPVLAQKSPDTIGKIAEEIQALWETCELVLTTGGVSVGQKDLLPQVAAYLGAEVLFHGVRAKPGAPTMAIWKNGKTAICLSGNPFAATVMLELLARPVLNRLSGKVCPKWHKAQGILRTSFDKPSKLRRFLRGRIEGGEIFLPSEGHGSGLLRNLRSCNCLVDIPEGTPYLKEGDLLETILF